VRCPDDMAAGFLGGLNITTLAKHRATRGLVLRAVERRAPGAYTYEIVRAKFIDEIVLGEAAAGLDELILLGAGLDSRPYRLAEQLRGVRVIEVDHPVSQASKRARVRRLLGREPEHVSFVAIDFMRDDLAAALAGAGHEHSARTLFIWSGVSPYLPEEAVADVLSSVGGHGSPRTSIVFDACWAEVIDGSREYYGAAELRKAVAETGEPLRWGIPEGRVHETLSCFGLQAERTLSGEEGRAAYLKRSDGTLHDPPYGFGVLVHARAS
jgi:methyltransferase (TIGR00027 family)